MLPGLSIDLRHGADGLQHMYLDNEDVSEEIRLPEISRYASAVSAVPEVRGFASIYREFKDLETFMRELEALKNEKEQNLK